MCSALLLLTLESLYVRICLKKEWPFDSEKVKTNSGQHQKIIRVRGRNSSEKKFRKAKKRVLENEVEFLQRKERDRTCTAKKRASETQDQATFRQECDKARAAKKRVSETQDETLPQTKVNRAYTARNRASETQDEALHRQERNRACTARKRASV